MKEIDKYIIDHTDVKDILTSYLRVLGKVITADAVFTVDSNSNVTVEVDKDLGTATSSTVPSPSPVGTVYPPDTVVVGEATMFGLNWDGSIDKGDNGVGAWGAKTANKDIVGVSLPEGVMIATFGFTGTWSENASKVGKFLGDNKIQVNVSKDGQSILADVVDAGPAGYTHNCIDLTYALAHKLNTRGKAIVSYSIIKDNVPMQVKGWDFKNGLEIAQPGVA